MRIAIIGAGWYGCHIASVLMNKKNYDISVYESNSIFSGISSYNQNRLHIGYHYPRSFQTRKESRNGFYKFLSKYEFLTMECENNFYAIHKDSIIDYESYLAIYKHEKYDFEIIENDKSKLSNYISVNEKVIDHIAAKKYFEDILKDKIRYKKFSYNDSEKFDLVIDCTCNRLMQYENDLIFERFLYFIIEIKQKVKPLIVMDGAFYSIFPITHKSKNNLYTLTNVDLGVIAKSRNFHTANNFYLTKNEENSLYQKTVEQYLSDIEYEYKFKDIILKEVIYSTKIKPFNNNDERKVTIIKNENILSVIPGKIDAIFTAEEQILEVLNDPDNRKYESLR